MTGGAAVAVASEMTGLAWIRDEDTGKERAIRRDCRVCYRVCDRVHGCAVVSPRGVAHVGLGGGDTACGRDATRDGWLWPL